MFYCQNGYKIHVLNVLPNAGLLKSFLFSLKLRTQTNNVPTLNNVEIFSLFSPWHIWCNIFSIYSPEQIHSITKKVFYGCCVDASSVTSNDITDFKD